MNETYECPICLVCVSSVLRIKYLQGFQHLLAACTEIFSSRELKMYRGIKKCDS